MIPDRRSVARAARSVGLVTTELARCTVDRVVPGRDGVPTRADALTPRWLEQALGVPPGFVRAVRVVNEDHGTASRARIEVDTDSDAIPRHLFVKSTPPGVVQRVFMNVMELGVREVLFYEAVAAEAPVRVPRCYAVQHDARRGRNVMVLEDLSERARFRDLREPLDATQATAVVDALADLHAAYWQSPRFGTDLSLLAARSPASTFLAEVFVERFVSEPRGPAADLVPDELRRASRVLFDHRAEIEAFWASEPRTLCHGDPHLGNLFFEGDRPGFLDWQAATAGPGMRDLAYFLSASVDVPVVRTIERDLVARYGTRLASHGVAVEPDDLWTRYRAAISEFYLAAVVTAGTGDRMQPQAITSLGVERAVAAAETHDTFSVLTGLATSRRA